MKYDIVTSGYMSIDRILKIESQLRTGYTSIISNSDNTKPFYGGCPINVSYLLAKQGMHPLPIIRVGEDEDTKGFLKYLKDGNVSLNGVRVIKNESSSNCYLISDKENNHVTVFYPGAMDSKYAGELEDWYFENSKMALITVGSYRDNMEFYRKCKKHNLPIVFGTKLDFDAFPMEFLKEILLGSNIIFSNESEAEDIKKILKINELTDVFLIGKADIIVTTLGERGSVFYKKNETGYETGHISTFKVEKVVDASGAGDAFVAGFLLGYLNGKSILEACQMGSVMSSFIIESVGCTTNAPDLEEFNNRLNQYLRSIEK